MRKVGGGTLAAIGFLLSPLSWWNDLFINIPLATAFAWVVALVYRPAFEAALIVGYWLTNVLGLVLLHKGAQQAAGPLASRSSRWRELSKDIVVSLLYTALIAALIQWGVLQPMPEYFRARP